MIHRLLRVRPSVDKLTLTDTCCLTYEVHWECASVMVDRKFVEKPGIMSLNLFVIFPLKTRVYTNFITMSVLSYNLYKQELILILPLKKNRDFTIMSIQWQKSNSQFFRVFILKSSNETKTLNYFL